MTKTAYANLQNKPEFNSWNNMLSRCSAKGTWYFPLYGGRGITVCEEWKTFANFLADMGPRPDGTTLDRIDPNGNYCKENCRWATNKEQCNNRRNNHILEYCGVALTMAMWARALRTPVETIAKRLRKKWPLERILVLRGRLSAFLQKGRAN